MAQVAARPLRFLLYTAVILFLQQFEIASQDKSKES